MPSSSEHLQFTVERSRDNRISFLDIEVIVKNICIITNRYRKTTFSGRLLKFKLSDKSLNYEKLSLIKQLLFDNDYPVDLVNTHIEKRFKFLNNNSKKSNPI